MACGSSKDEVRTFYRVSLACANDPQIAWGSRIKPLFTETARQPEIKESWVNREGTSLAFLWKEGISAEEKNNIIQSLFRQCSVEAERINDEAMLIGSIPMVVGAAVRQMLAVTKARFGADSDFTHIAKVLEEWAGVEIRG